MAFLTRTRIVQVGTGTPSNPVPIDPVVFRTLNQGVVVETVPLAMAQVQASQRPPEADWWMYVVEWQIDYVVTPHIRGMRPDSLHPNILVFDAHFWENQSIKNANPNNPSAMNTFLYPFTTSRAADALGAIRTSMDKYLLDFHWQGLPVDYRDLTLVTSNDPQYDTLGILPQVQPFSGQTFNVTAEWRRGS
jgi:hypothetical protein